MADDEKLPISAGDGIAWPQGELRRTTEPRTAAEWAALLSRRIEESGLSVARFARDVLRRDPRSVWRWLNGESPIPAEVKKFLLEPEPAPWP